MDKQKQNLSRHLKNTKMQSTHKKGMLIFCM